MRNSLRYLAIATLLASLHATALAEPTGRRGGKLVTVPVIGPQAHATADVLYLNRCRDGCTITKAGLNDARTHLSQIPNGAPGETFMLGEYAYGDAEWDALMTCMREVYSPYGVTITDVLPANGVAYNEGIIAGIGAELGLNGVGGIAPSGCSAQQYTVSFSFANQYGPNSTYEVCWTAAQETAHSFGLGDHAFEYLDGRSACNDPMTYRSDCGGQKFFRNEQVRCGEFVARACECSSPNSHLKLLSELGPGTNIVPPPTVEVTQPAAGAQIAQGSTVIANAFSQRGVAKVELWLNGYKWAERPGAAFGTNGQPLSGYAIAIPNDVPDGVIDIVVKAKDDIDVTTTTTPIIVTKGAPCATAETCADGQRCESGRCFWDPPVGELGDTCTFSQYCVSAICQGVAEQKICTQTCVPGVGDSCPMDYTCLQSSPGNGVCWPASEDTGCCSTSNDNAAHTAGVLLLVVVVVLGRRRR